MATTLRPLPTSDSQDPVAAPKAPKWAGAVSGVLAGGAALAAGEVAGALGAPKPGPVIAVTNRVIDLAPGWFVDFGKAVFGLNDKIALIIGTVILSVIFAAILGVVSLKRPAVGAIGIAGFGVLGWAAIGVDAQGGWGFGLVVAAVAVFAGVATLGLLLARINHSIHTGTTCLLYTSDAPTIA